MQPTPILDETGWSRLIQDAAYFFDDLTLKRGFQYYKQGRVSPPESPSPGLIAAVVEGSERYRVEVVLTALSISSCSCPIVGPCKHMAAVLMEVADAQGLPVQQLANAHSAARARAAGTPSRDVARSAETGYYGSRSAEESKAFHEGGGVLRSGAPAEAEAAVGAGGLRREQGTERLKERGRLIPVMNASEWQELFGQCLAPLAGDIRNPRYAQEALSAIARIKPPLRPGLEKLFGTHARLYVLNALTVRHNGRSGAAVSLGYYTHLAATELQTEIEELMQTGVNADTGPDLQGPILDTLGLLRGRMLSPSHDPAFYAGLYYLLWQRWILPCFGLGAGPLIREELRLLEQEDAASAGHSAPAALTARAFMHARLSEDGKALDLLREAAGQRGFRPPLLAVFWEHPAEAGEWERLLHWLQETGPLLSGYHPEILKGYSGYWERAAAALPEAEPLMWDALASLLPSAGEHYEELLLKHGRWLAWMDYQLSSGKDPLDFRVRELQPLEKHAPELLLPFYHQAVERYVAAKNRAGYKTAVKLLKRLDKLYRKLKEEERFESFLSGFASRHNRLRALQEELRKGKLIP